VSILTTRVMRRRPGNCLASLGSVCLLSRVHVEPDVVSVSVILIQTGVASKVGSYRRHKRYSDSVRRLAPLRTFILDSRKSPCFPVDRSSGETSKANRYRASRLRLGRSAPYERLL
jgi:hypothetical protein